MTEKMLQDAIVECARLLGYTHIYHPWLSAKSVPGYPDLTLLNPGRGRLVVIECKAERGRVTLAQAGWLLAFRECGATVAVIRPSDWVAGKVEEILR